MTAITLKETEGAPAAWPAVVSWGGDFRASQSGDPIIDTDVTWQRIEAWIAWRWPSRAVTYIAEGPGDWSPRLQPFAITATDLWQDGAWASVTLEDSPLGGVVLPGNGPYRITGTAGDDTSPPEAVMEAARRLHEFTAGIAHHKHEEAAALQAGETAMPRGWAGKTLHLSGAADLLRPWRNLQ